MYHYVMYIYTGQARKGQKSKFSRTTFMFRINRINLVLPEKSRIDGNLCQFRFSMGFWNFGLGFQGPACSVSITAPTMAATLA